MKNAQVFHSGERWGKPSEAQVCPERSYETPGKKKTKPHLTRTKPSPQLQAGGVLSADTLWMKQGTTCSNSREKNLHQVLRNQAASSQAAVLHMLQRSSFYCRTTTAGCTNVGVLKKRQSIAAVPHGILVSKLEIHGFNRWTTG